MAWLRPFSRHFSLILLFEFEILVSAFDQDSNEMPVDPNNGIKPAFTNEPIVLRPMPHQPSDYEKAPFHFWHENKPFVHVHGAEPEHPELRHQHFAKNYYENFDNFITDAPGTGLNVRSIISQPPRRIAHLDTNRDNNKSTTSNPSHSDSLIGISNPNEIQSQIPGPTKLISFNAELPLVIKPEKSSHHEETAREFPLSSFVPSKRLPAAEAPHQTASGSRRDEEDGEESKRAAKLPWDDFKSGKDFDAYEDVPSISPKRIPNAVAVPFNFARTTLQPTVRDFKINSIRQPQKQLVPGGGIHPRLLPFDPVVQKHREQGKSKAERNKLPAEIGSQQDSVSRRPPTPVPAPIHAEGEASAIVVEEVSAASKNYIQEKPSTVSRINPYPGAAYQPLPHARHPSAYQQTRPTACCCANCSPNSCGASCSRRCSSVADCSAPCGCCCPVAGNGNKCCNGGSDESPLCICTIRLVITCCPQQRSCCGRRLLTSKARLLFKYSKRRLRRSGMKAR